MMIKQVRKHEVQGDYSKYSLCMIIFIIQKFKSVYSPKQELPLNEAMIHDGVT
jgi:hypothetical protein